MLSEAREGAVAAVWSQASADGVAPSSSVGCTLGVGLHGCNWIQRAGENAHAHFGPKRGENAHAHFSPVTDI